MRTAQQVESDYADQLGRCEFCGQLTAESELNSITWRGSPELLCCDDCYTELAS